MILVPKVLGEPRRKILVMCAVCDKEATHEIVFLTCHLEHTTEPVPVCEEHANSFADVRPISG
jgi:hypothetical protein